MKEAESDRKGGREWDRRPACAGKAPDSDPLAPTIDSAQSPSSGLSSLDSGLFADSDLSPDARVTPETAALAALSTAHSTKSLQFFRTIAQFGIQAAEALDHAHKQGVLHRDVKPANLILDGAGNLWMTDFGLARLEANPGMTMTGDLIGTLRYMSPEQALAKRVMVDHRTDIYSLGVTLYELLTLQPAYPGRDREELLKKIAFTEPKGPRRLNPAIPAELETITLKAMAKNPEERYATAQELADDLRCYLLDRPIQAKRPSLLNRARKWSRRHRPVVWSAAAVLAIAAVTLIVGGLWHNAQLQRALRETAQQRERAEQQRARAETALAEVSRQRGRAENNLHLALKAVDDMYNNVAAEDLMHDELEGVHLAQVPHMTPFRRTVLENALAFYREFSRQNTSAPDLQLETTRAYRRVGEIHFQLGENRQAEEAYRQAIALASELGTDLSCDPKHASELASAWHGLGHLLKNTGRAEEAQAAVYRALTLSQDAVAHDPDCREYLNALARMYNCWGVELRWKDQKKKEEAYAKALAIHEDLVQSDPENPKFQHHLAAIYHNQGISYRESGRPAEAESNYRKAQTIMENLVREHPDDPSHKRSLALLHIAKAGHYQRTKRLAEAIASCDKAVEIMVELVDDYPSVPDYQNLLATSYSGLAVLRDATAPEEAMASCRNALKIFMDLCRKHPDVLTYQSGLALAQFRLGLLQRDAGRSQEAVASFEQLFRDELLGRPWPKKLKEQNACSVSRVFFKMGEYDRAIEVLSPLVEAGDPIAIRNVSVVLDVMGEYDRAIEVLSPLVEAGDPMAMNNRACSYLATRRYREAYEDYTRGLEIAPDNGALMLGMAMILTFGPEELRDVPRARELGERMAKLGDYVAPGMAFYQSGEYQRAAELLSKLRETEGDSNPYQAARFVLAMSYWKLGETDTAREIYRDAVQRLNEKYPKATLFEEYRTRAAQLLGIDEKPTEETKQTADKRD